MWTLFMTSTLSLLAKTSWLRWGISQYLERREYTYTMENSQTFCNTWSNAAMISMQTHQLVVHPPQAQRTKRKHRHNPHRQASASRVYIKRVHTTFDKGNHSISPCRCGISNKSIVAKSHPRWKLCLVAWPQHQNSKPTFPGIRWDTKTTHERCPSGCTIDETKIGRSKKGKRWRDIIG